jgi:hypothetical protein
LEDIAKSLGFSVTIISRDEPQMINHDGYYIINLDTAHGGYGGNHWVGLIIKEHLFKHYIVHYNDVNQMRAVCLLWDF